MALRNSGTDFKIIDFYSTEGRNIKKSLTDFYFLVEPNENIEPNLSYKL